MLNTVLFDLDGTLLPIDMKQFEQVYFGGLIKQFDGIIDGENLVRIIWEATKVMVANKEKISNETVFMNHLKTLINPEDFDLYLEKFESYYQGDFDRLKTIVNPNPAIQQAVNLLKQKGYDLILCTNPLFPEIAIKKRVQWAGFAFSDFKYITTFEKNHYCKPQIEYYQEVLQDNQLTAQQCLMVGNDPVEDLIASTIGIKTFLIDTHILKKETALIPDYQGDYDVFYQFVLALPSLN